MGFFFLAISILNSFHFMWTKNLYMWAEFGGNKKRHFQSYFRELKKIHDFPSVFWYLIPSWFMKQHTKLLLLLLQSCTVYLKLPSSKSSLNWFAVWGMQCIIVPNCLQFTWKMHNTPLLENNMNNCSLQKYLIITSISDPVIAHRKHPGVSWFIILLWIK